MLTQCPSCQTTFRVTSEILRVADGQVRCGRCQTQFDALERLFEETDSGEIESGRPIRTPPRPAPPQSIEVEEPPSHEDITLEGRHIAISGTYRIPDALRGKAQFREEVTEEWFQVEEPDLEPQADEPPGPDGIDSPAQSAVQVLEDDVDEPLAAESAVEQEAAAAAPPARARALRTARRQAAPAADPEFLGRPRRPLGWLWKLAAAPLVLLLLVQILHSQRTSLARHPQLGPPLARLYQSLGLTLQPQWDLKAYRLEQWRLGSDPALPGTLRGRASIRNGASYPQPYPLLRLVLQDRWGNAVRARDFTPAEYLAQSPDRLLGPAEETTAVIAIVDPGQDTEGFEVDLCLEGARGTVCANDVPEEGR